MTYLTKTPLSFMVIEESVTNTLRKLSVSFTTLYDNKV